MNRAQLRKTIGGTAVVLSACWIWGAVIYPLANFIAEEKDASDYVFMFSMVCWMAVPGILLAYFGFSLFRSMTETSVRWVAGLLAAYGAVWISVRLSHAYPEFVPEELESSLFLFLATLIVIPAYLFGTRTLAQALDGERRSCWVFAGRGLIVVVALQMWMLLSNIFDVYSPIKEGTKYLHEEPWGILGLIVPIAISYGFYQLACNRLELNRAEQMSGAVADKLRSTD